MLAAHRTLGAAPRQELEWLVTHGSLHEMDSGDVVTGADAIAAGLFIVLSGRIAIFVDRGSGPHKITEWREGGRDRNPPVPAHGPARPAPRLCKSRRRCSWFTAITFRK